MAKRQLTQEEKKALLLKKKKQELLKKKKEELEKHKKEPEPLKLLTDKERAELAKDLKSNALATFARFDFYKDGYKKTLGIAIFTLLTFLVSTYGIIYAQFIYSPKSTYIATNNKGQILTPISLKAPIFKDSYIVDFASTAYKKISSYNYVNIEDDYFDELLPYFTESSLKDYKTSFRQSNESNYVLKEHFIVKAALYKGSRINQEESERLTKETGRKTWVVTLNVVKLYQNEKNYVRKAYKTDVIVQRTSTRENENKIAILNFIDHESIKKD